ncbi:hypothetical protein CPHO_07695 [Corynebacterium phocae]|uniref:SWIM-type domain-containing protein n=1 Tax=Corynebacterium phocae TaxID=161895 RepID=A0A1L7D4C7_9CORY|nr:hypothetical protein [Corynebacterium phocae]APT92792.1 hypothetical protein CPHO_07695 [Corynebacterium phocae]KAA8723106.1 hypothetical protein F4V58_07200 [Corynebacterium phocae]
MATRDDNIIYVNFGARGRGATPQEISKVDKSGRPGTGVSLAGQRLVAAVEGRTDAGRLKRGRDYARKGHVVDIDVRNGAVHGQVAGSQNDPFAVLVRLPYRSNDELGKVAEILARTTNAIRDAQEGELPSEVVDILLAEDSQDISFGCDCPDSAWVCKHIVAVVDCLVAKIDADPAVIFEMRGITFAKLEQLIMAKAPEVAADATREDGSVDPDERNELFWNGRTLPDLPEPKVAPALEDSDMDALKRALRTVSHTNIELLRAISDIEDLYDHLTRQ